MRGKLGHRRHRHNRTRTYHPPPGRHILTPTKSPVWKTGAGEGMVISNWIKRDRGWSRQDQGGDDGGRSQRLTKRGTRQTKTEHGRRRWDGKGRWNQGGEDGGRSQECEEMDDGPEQEETPGGPQEPSQYDGVAGRRSYGVSLGGGSRSVNSCDNTGTNGDPDVEPG